MLSAALQSIQHRGPDSTSSWISDAHNIGLGHTRLGIIGIDNGTQPIKNEVGSIVTVVNGELYDYKRIRTQLIEQGHIFKTDSDSEILIHLYEEYGLQMFEYLRGEFAFILWDERNRTLIAARDRFGIKPLFYTQQEDAFYFASEIKALFTMGISACWDKQSLFNNFFFYPSMDRTLYQGICQIPPAHYLLITEHNYSIRNYWNFDYPKKGEFDTNSNIQLETEVIEELRKGIYEAVKLRLVSDVKVGCYLSGGIDSSSVLGIASQVYGKPLDAFTIGFHLPIFNESEVAMETATHCGAHFNLINISQNDLATYFQKSVVSLEILMENSHWVARYLLSRYVRQQGIKVVLAGEGADEVFGGYAGFVEDLKKINDVAPKSIFLKNKLPISKLYENMGYQVTNYSLSKVEETLGFIPAFLRNLIDQRAIFHSLLTDDFRYSFDDPYVSFLGQSNLTQQLKERNEVVQSFLLWSRSILTNYILVAERMDMAHSVEVRLPYLDHKLVACTTKIPADVLLKSYQEKYLYRKCVEPFVTSKVFKRKKRPFLAPPLTTKDPLYEMMYDTLSSLSISAMGCFNKNAVKRLLNDYVNTENSYVRLNLEPVLIMILSACILQKHYKISF
ncbi:asparagine synthase (glutamine-hydrolyzing) [Sporomusa sphaeroides]